MATRHHLIANWLIVLGLFLAARPLSGAQQTNETTARDFSAYQRMAVERVEAGEIILKSAETGTPHITLRDVNFRHTRVDMAACDAFLTRLLVGEEVYVDPTDLAAPAANDSKVKNEPRAARLFRAPDGLDVSLELVRQGYAPAGPDTPVEERELFRQAEARAKKFNRGIWGHAAMVANAAPANNGDKANAPRAGTPDAAAELVYVTPTGKKYHRANCQHVGKTARAIPLQEAKAKYQPCSRCKPPE